MRIWSSNLRRKTPEGRCFYNYTERPCTCYKSLNYQSDGRKHCVFNSALIILVLINLRIKYNTVSFHGVEWRVDYTPGCENFLVLQLLHSGGGGRWHWNDDVVDIKRTIASSSPYGLYKTTKIQVMNEKWTHELLKKQEHCILTLNVQCWHLFKV